MSFEENYFDFSYSIGSLEHFTEDGIEKVIDKLHKCTRIASYHMMPTSRDNKNQGWMKTYQTFIITIKIGGSRNSKKNFQEFML